MNSDDGARAETGWAEKPAPLVEIYNLTYTYPEAPSPLLQGVNLTIHRGELTILTGPSGCGKSTLCRHLNGIIPHLSSGQILEGTVNVMGLNVAETPVHRLATHVGMVHQNPESQIVCLEVRDELAFGPENIGLSHEEITERVADAIDWVQLHSIADSLTFACSGGQKQRLALGSSLTLLPELLVLDEPTTDLDPVGAQEVVATIAALRDRLGLTFLIVEHDLDELLEIADRLIVMDNGRIVFDGQPAWLLQNHYDALLQIGLRIPQHIVVAHRLSRFQKKGQLISIHREDVLRDFARVAERLPATVQLPQRTRTAGLVPAEPAVRVTNLSFSYDGVKQAIDNASLEIQRGEFVALVGANASGKSTMARLILGLLRPDQGRISVLGMDTRSTPLEELCTRVGYLFQNPDAQLFNTSVEGEVAFGMKVRGLEKTLVAERVTDVLALLGLEKYRKHHPFALSRGERQRLALATVLVTDPDLIILDEPTTGQDRRMLESLLTLMQQWIARKQATILMIAHDMNLVCEYAERTVVMENGSILCDGATSDVFYDSFHQLRAMSLLPPPLVEMTYPLIGTALSRPLLSLEEFDWLLSSLDGKDAQAAQFVEVDRNRRYEA
jgi:energy-coupling factor transport system ATP-binding protein